MADCGTLERLAAAILDGDRQESLSLTEVLLADQASAETIVLKAVEPAMDRLGAKCTLEHFNLLEIMLAGRAVMAVMGKLFPQSGSGPGTRGTIVLASLEGDIHDLGKNVLKTVLLAKGYTVVDCGRDCPVDDVVSEATRTEADAIGISGLITTVIPKVRQVKEVLQQEGTWSCVVLAGGAALKQATASQLNVDFVADTCFDGAHYLQQRLGETHDQE